MRCQTFGHRQPRFSSIGLPWASLSVANRDGAPTARNKDVSGTAGHHAGRQPLSDAQSIGIRAFACDD
ncbi:hypothetical protein EB241_03580 [Erwinia psidii]|uniref:Uncharacterized protein n=1 Tax=Erwinia psidii TaxID=69224 RepID=A0A3N6SL28_9GAMM|nr:hypothetical protein EB241_03580 [Erwinia psidii]